jgi:hypothetical protein
MDLEEIVWGEEDWAKWLLQGHEAGCCEQVNEPWGTIKRWEFLDLLRNC